MLWLPSGLIIWGLLFRTTELAGKKKRKEIINKEELERKIPTYAKKAVFC